MEGSFYDPNQLFVATKAPSVIYDLPLAPISSSQHQPFDIFPNEESVDFSALVEACENTTIISPNRYSTHSSTSNGPLSSAGLFDSSETQAFTFDNKFIGMYHDTGFLPPTSLSHHMDFSPQPSLINSTSTGATPQIPMSPLVGTDPAPGKSPRGKAGKKKSMDKNSTEYRDKRDRNNIAVRKSRNKSKLRVLETEQRVKELEDENKLLQNKIALLSKELNVLKSLFASAGVTQPPVKMELGDITSCQASSN